VTYSCPHCRRKVAKEDRRRKERTFAAIGDAKLTMHGTVPKVQCECGKVLIFIEGKV
jgi:hypothetical protein